MKCFKCGKELICCTVSCESCGKLFTPINNTHIYCSDRCRWQGRNEGSKIDSAEFERRMREKVRDRYGTVLSVKTTTRAVFRSMNLISEDIKFSEAQIFYRLTERTFTDMGGENISMSSHAGKQFQFPTLKEREE